MDSPLQEIQAVYSLVSVAVLSRIPIGTSVFDNDWDLLIVLDACRVDALEEVSSDFEFLNTEQIESRWSVGSTSKEWINQTFVNEYSEDLKNTAYITGNGFGYDLRDPDRKNKYVEFEDTWIGEHPRVQKILPDGLIEESDLGLLDGLWGNPDRPQDAENERLPATITDHTIWVGRHTDHDRVISHYMQPHAPLYASADSYTNLKDYERNPFAELKKGESKATVWEAYLENLRFVLSNIEILLSNFDGEKVVITADHGELFGEWGLYSHPAGVPHPALRRVPWVEITATDLGTHSPDVGEEEVIERKIDRAAEESLKALGYL